MLLADVKTAFAVPPSSAVILRLRADPVTFCPSSSKTDHHPGFILPLSAFFSRLSLPPPFMLLLGSSLPLACVDFKAAFDP